LFVFGATAPSVPGLPHSLVFWITHNDAPQSVELLWTSDQLVAECVLTLVNINFSNSHLPLF